MFECCLFGRIYTIFPNVIVSHLLWAHWIYGNQQYLFFLKMLIRGYLSVCVRAHACLIFIWLSWVLVVACELVVEACELLTGACKVLVPWPGSEPGPPAFGVLSLSHWPTREVSLSLSFFFFKLILLKTATTIKTAQVKIWREIILGLVHLEAESSICIIISLFQKKKRQRSNKL